MRYDLEADWKLLDSCNFRCAYCFDSPELLGRKLAGLPPYSDWITAFAATGKTWLLHITGGEPSLYPNFAELCARLVERHYLSLNTNLSQPAIREFAARVDPARVSLVHAALHPAERERRRGLAAFIGNLDVLAAHRHPLMVSVVATPEVLERFDDIARSLEPSGFRPVPKLFRGLHKGRLYPDAYTERDHARFQEASTWAREGYRALEQSVSEQPTIWPLYDDAMLDGERAFHGQDCDAGHRMVAIRPNGDVYRCSTATRHGNLLTGDVRLNASATPCDTSFCYYFCAKYLRPKFYDFAKPQAFPTHSMQDEIRVAR